MPLSKTLRCVFLLALFTWQLRADEVRETQANVVIELTFTAAHDYKDPSNDVTMDATIIDPTGRELRVPAFWDGKNVWKIRYASPVVGSHSYRTDSSDKSDAGLNAVVGKIEVKPYTGENPLYIHGPVRVAPDHRHLQYTDGKPFFWLGDTWWMGLCHRLHFPDEFKTLTADRKKKGFNVVQLVAGLYPDMFPFDPRGANEAGYPWERDYARINPAYFDEADKRLFYLSEQGFTPCIVGAWGYFMPWMGVHKMEQQWRYLIARYGAMPVVWCAAGEANLSWYLAKGFPYDDRKQVTDWTTVMRYIRETDPFHRPLTVHPTGLGRLSSRHATDDVNLLDIDMLQTPHAEAPAVAPTVQTVRQSYADHPVMPVIDGEASYEQLLGSIKTEWTRRMFWLCMTNGAAGHTYGANGIWQCNRKGQPHGPSPWKGSPPTGYGTISWDEAMNLPGSAQVGFGKKLFEEFNWQEFRPHPEWVAYAAKASLSLDGASWIWSSPNSAQNAPAGKRYFRRTFSIPKGKTIKSAQLRATADDRFAASVNSKSIGKSPDTAEAWKIARQFDDLAQLLRPGENVLTIQAENVPTNGNNPAGLIARLEVRFDDGDPFQLVTDESWQASDHESGPWTKANVAAKYGQSPWGSIDGLPSDDVHGPQATGIPGVVRLIYVPDPQPITVQGLVPHATYFRRIFDPVTGANDIPPPIDADADGAWTCPPPSTYQHDWVLILEQLVKGAKDGHARQSQLLLENESTAWRLDWRDGHLTTVAFDNTLSGHSFAVPKSTELSLVFSASPTAAAQPFTICSDFAVTSSNLLDAEHADFTLHNASMNVDVVAHYVLDGPTRRKWFDIINRGSKDLLLLDVNLDDLQTDGSATGGGEGEPVFLEGEVFATVEHPAGDNQGKTGRVQLSYYPGRKLAAGQTYTTHAAIVSVAKTGGAHDHFLDYIQSKSVRAKKMLSAYTPLGINNLWGGAPTLTDEETLDVLNLLAKWQKHGVRFDYFTLDTGWIDPDNLKHFRPNCYPDGPAKVVQRVEELGMKFGLWFATAWGTQSAWDDPAAFRNGQRASIPWREGYPIGREGVTFCIGDEPYHRLLKEAVLHHIKENHARFVKFDGGDYVCNDPSHTHLPGKYSIDPRFENLIDIAGACRKEAPDVFVMWYWGLRSPFWALYGDTIFESGLMMEGSATSAFPALYYRDSVSLAQDQNAQHAVNIPPIVKDSLGVWLADDRWGNFMGKSRWREATIMDLARGNMLVPNLWGDIYQLSDGDVDFLSRFIALTKKHEDLFLHRHKILGDPWHNDVYGYAYGHNSTAMIFINNVHFASRPAEIALDERIGLTAKPGTPINVISHFPNHIRLLRPDGQPYKIGDTLSVHLRPFEYLALEVTSESPGDIPIRAVTRDGAAKLGQQLSLSSVPLSPEMDIPFADAAKFESQGYKKKSHNFATTLPSTDRQNPSILAVVIRLRRGQAEWRDKLPLCRLVQAMARIDGRLVEMSPVPDSRQYGNTQGIEGCSWVVYKTRLSKSSSGKPLKISVHAYVPDGVDAQVEGWVVKRWWQEDARPTPDGFYTDEPS